MKQSDTIKESFVTDRRRLLLGVGAAGGAIAAGLTSAQAAGNAGAEQVTDAPVSNKMQERQPFHGEHQAGIVTPRPAAGMIVTFDVLAQTPRDVEQLFRTLTDRIKFLMAGGTPPAFDPKLPPSDSGILGPIVPPDNLTITVSLGDSFFAKRDWLAPLKPVRLSRMTGFPNDALDPALCHGDISLQICANTPDATIHALRDILKIHRT